MTVGDVSRREMILAIVGSGFSPLVASGSRARLRDFWSDESLGRHDGSVTVKDVPAHGARLLVLESAP